MSERASTKGRDDELASASIRPEPSSVTFVIADLHGRLDLLEMAYDRIVRHAAFGTIIHLGDYVDRGPQSRQIIEWLMNDKTIPLGFKRVCLKGNHEDMMVETLTAPLDPTWWVGNGGGATLVSYGEAGVPVRHVEWMSALPHAHEDEHRVYVHAGVDPTLSMAAQTAETLLWYRYPQGANIGFNGKHVVHGHTPNPAGPELFEHRTNLDTYAWKTGKLFVAVFDDERAGGPVHLLNLADATPNPLSEGRERS